MNELISLRDAAERIDYGLTTSASDSSVGPKFLRITDIDKSYIDWRTVPTCETTESEAHKYELKTGDIVVARTGASTGRSQCVEVETATVFASYLVRFRIKNTFDSRFIGYVLASKPWFDFVSGVAHGKSAQPNMSAAVMAEFVFDCPPLEQQQAIAEVLGALDDKIAANTKLAETADDWIRARYSKLRSTGDISISVADIVTHRRNSANPESFEKQVPYVGLEHLPRRSIWLGEQGSSGEVSSNKSKFHSGDILFGKLRPYFHKIVTAPTAGICSTDILVLTPIASELAGYALAALADDTVVQAVTAASQGTRMPRTSWNDLSTVEILWPGESAAKNFSASVEEVREYAIATLAENRTLATTRDTLLPRLMSGELRVRDAERIVSAAV